MLFRATFACVCRVTYLCMCSLTLRCPVRPARVHEHAVRIVTFIVIVPPPPSPRALHACNSHGATITTTDQRQICTVRRRPVLDPAGVWRNRRRRGMRERRELAWYGKSIMSFDMMLAYLSLISRPHATRHPPWNIAYTGLLCPTYWMLIGACNRMSCPIN